MTNKDLAIEVYTNVRKDWEILMYISRRNNPEINNLINNDLLLGHWRFLTFKSIMIEIPKLVYYKKNNKTGYTLLCGILIDAIKESEIKRKHRVYSKFHRRRDFITQIRNSRDKFYAHLDPDHLDYISKSISMSNLEKLVFTLNSVMYSLIGRNEMNEVLSQIPSRHDYVILNQLT